MKKEKLSKRRLNYEIFETQITHKRKCFEHLESF